MATFEIATKANLALTLPGLLVAIHLNLEHPSLLSTVTKTFRDGVSLADKEIIRMTCDDGKTWAGQTIIRHLAEIANSNTSLERAFSVCTWSPVRGDGLLIFV